MVPPKVVSILSSGCWQSSFLFVFFFSFLPTIRIAGLKDTEPRLLCPDDCLNYSSYSSCSQTKLNHIARLWLTFLVIIYFNNVKNDEVFPSF